MSRAARIQIRFRLGCWVSVVEEGKHRTLYVTLRITVIVVMCFYNISSVAVVSSIAVPPLLFAVVLRATLTSVGVTGVEFRIVAVFVPMTWLLAKPTIWFSMVANRSLDVSSL